MSEILRVESQDGLHIVYLRGQECGALLTPIQTQTDYGVGPFGEFFDRTPRIAVSFIMQEIPRKAPTRKRRTPLDLGLRRPK